jgi:hypothetical protein
LKTDPENLTQTPRNEQLARTTDVPEPRIRPAIKDDELHRPGGFETRGNALRGEEIGFTDQHRHAEETLFMQPVDRHQTKSPE